MEHNGSSKAEHYKITTKVYFLRKESKVGKLSRSMEESIEGRLFYCYELFRSTFP